MAERALEEREWTDRFGTHYEVLGRGRSGCIYSMKVVRMPFWGWGASREEARATVRSAMAGDIQGDRRSIPS